MIVRRAKLALKDADTVGALRALDDRARLFPNGVYAEEAAVIRIETLVMAGERARATEEGRAFLRLFPDSPYGQRVRGLSVAVP
jgi:outer membrane protein assembly factor BamD (BamD/ComL family)